MTTPTDADRSAPPPTAGDRFDRLVQIMRRLRSPDGCAWDREQTLASLRPFVLEEAYEVVDAIDRDDRSALCDETGDLLLEGARGYGENDFKIPLARRTLAAVMAEATETEI